MFITVFIYPVPKLTLAASINGDTLSPLETPCLYRAGLKIDSPSVSGLHWRGGGGGALG